MTSQIIAILAAAGLVTAGVSATAETRSAGSLPTAQTSMLPLSVLARDSIRMGQAIDCDLDENDDEPECQEGGAAKGKGFLVPGLAIAAAAGGLALALGQKSP